MGPSTASPCPDRSPELEGMPAEVREALKEVSAAEKTLNRDQAAAITEQAFERAADLRERAEALRRRKATILREWQQTKAAKPTEPGVAPDPRR